MFIPSEFVCLCVILGRNIYRFVYIMSLATRPKFWRERLKWDGIYRRNLIKTFGYDPHLEIMRNRMLHRGYRKENRKLITERTLEEVKDNIMDENIGSKIHQKPPLAKNITASFKTLGRLNLRLIHFKNILKKLTGEKKTTYSRQEMRKFLKFIIDKYIPYKLFDRKKYMKKFRNNCVKVILANYKQGVFLADIMRGLNSKCNMGKRQLRAKIALWVVKTLILIVGNLFYVTEGAKCRELTFYNQRYWIQCQRKAVEDLEMNHEVKCIQINPIDTGLGSMRFVPKQAKNTLRPLVLKSIDQRYQTQFTTRTNLLLKQLVACKRGKYPNVIPDLHAAWVDFVEKNRSHKDKLYFVKTDIKNAYGSIVHDKLKQVVTDLFDDYITSEELSLQTCTYQGLWKIMETEQFQGLTQSLSQKVVSNIDRKKTVSAHKLKLFVVYFIDNIKVHLGYTHKSYQFVKGVPQGSPLSAALCEIYYNDLDDKYLGFTNEDEGDICMRAVDDYLFVSRSKERASRFLSLMESGFPEYGVSVQKEKTVTNLHDETEWVPYFGFRLNVRSKQVKPNLESYRGVHLLSTMSLKKVLNLWLLKDRLLYTHTLKMQSILFDARFQWKRTMIENVFDAASINALRYDSIVNEMTSSDQANTHKLVDCIFSSVCKISGSSLKKINSDLVSSTCLKYISIKAFIKVLEKRREHLAVVKQLKRIGSRLLRSLGNRETKLVHQVGKKISTPLETCYNNCI